MRIALYHNLPSGGAKRHTCEQVRELARRGHEIVEFAPSTADLTYCSFAPFVKERRIFDLTPVQQTDRRIPLVTPYLHAVEGLMTLRRIERLDRAIARAIDGGGFDLAFVKDCRIAANPYVLRHLATPSVFQCHHGLRHRTERSKAGDGNGHDRRLGEWLKAAYYAPAHGLFDYRLFADEARNIRSASAVLTNSRFSRELLEQHYSVRSDVIYPGIDVETFRPMPLAKMDYVLSVGALVYSKGYRFLVSALARMDAARRPGLLVAANSVDPDERRLVEEMAAAAGVDLRVEEIGDDHRLVQVYNQARAFVYAPLREALGMAPLEAMACGTPVVAVAEGGVRETVLDGVTGWLVPRDVGAFAARLEALLGDDRTRLRMGQAGVEYVRRDWSWQRAVDTLESRFHSLLSRG